uniref:Uncharacterized protein n=1 Tax=Ditylenchus dipsaci TaxID=166011 RepID=A0A915CT04_9BILA
MPEIAAKCAYTCVSKENVAECLKKILPDMVYKTKAPLYTLQEEDYCTVHLMFPSENKNTLVGDKSQTNMVALREKLKVNMTNFRLFADECPQSSERVIRIKHAFDDQIIKMITAILPIIMAPVKEPQLLYEPIYHDPRLARTYGGYTEDYDNRYTWQNPNYSSHQAVTIPKEFVAQLKKKDFYSLLMCSAKSRCQAKILEADEQSNECTIALRGPPYNRKLLINLLRRSLETTEAGRLYLHGDAAKKTYFTKLPKAVQQDETLGEDGKEEKF